MGSLQGHAGLSMLASRQLSWQGEEQAGVPTVATKKVSLLASSTLEHYRVLQSWIEVPLLFFFSSMFLGKAQT